MEFRWSDRVFLFGRFEPDVGGRRRKTPHHCSRRVEAGDGPRRSVFSSRWKAVPLHGLVSPAGKQCRLPGVARFHRQEDAPGRAIQSGVRQLRLPAVSAAGDTLCPTVQSKRCVADGRGSTHSRRSFL